MFEYVDEPINLVRVHFESHDYQLPDGENLAAALLAAGVHHFRQTPSTGTARAPFCMMGACFECLVEIDGQTKQACLVKVKEGLVVNKVKPIRNIANDKG